MSLPPGPFAEVFSDTFPKSAAPTRFGNIGASPIRRATFATGYAALMLLGITLLIGPVNLLLGRSNPVSSYLRRDVGIWAAILSIVHVVVGLGVHGDMSGGAWSIQSHFVANGWPLTNSFGLANWAGLAALVIVVVLLALSADSTIRRLKAKKWRGLQRLNYGLFALVVLHAFFYGALLRITSSFTTLLILLMSAVVVGQVMDTYLWRHRSRMTHQAESDDKVT